jgi:hypothetical protein
MQIDFEDLPMVRSGIPYGTFRGCATYDNSGCLEQILIESEEKGRPDLVISFEELFDVHDDRVKFGADSMKLGLWRGLSEALCIRYESRIARVKNVVSPSRRTLAGVEA